VAVGFVLRYGLRDGSMAGERQFAALPIRIGRNPLNDCPVPQPFVSHFHARIEELDGTICVRDLNSKNGILLRTGERIPPQTPVDLASYGHEFWIGPFMRVKLEFIELSGLPAQRPDKPSGTVLGNRTMLEQGLPGEGPGALPSMMGRGSPLPSAPPMPPPPLQASLPPLAGAPQRLSDGSPTPAEGMRNPRGSPGFAPAAYQTPPPPNYSNMPPMAGAPHLPPVPNAGAPNMPQRGSAPPGAPFAGGTPRQSDPGVGVGKNTQYFGMALEVLALLGLRELGSSLVPGQPLETTGDIARLITKLHDTVEVFCRCFVPLREGYAQFVSSMDLQQAASQRALSRSNAYRKVEYARDPAQVASALLDWRDPALDAPSAVEGIMADLMLHQVALLDGVMQGVRALLADLSPDNIEKLVDERRSFSLGRYRALWQAYRQRFDELSQESEAFSRIFGSEFTAAYREHERNRGEPPRNR
jgi:type VI secretion system protein ImpI